MGQIGVGDPSCGRCQRPQRPQHPSRQGDGEQRGQHERRQLHDDLRAYRLVDLATLEVREVRHDVEAISAGAAQRNGEVPSRPERGVELATLGLIE